MNVELIGGSVRGVVVGVVSMASVVVVIGVVVGVVGVVACVANRFGLLKGSAGSCRLLPELDSWDR